jgi:hypothetical protein
LPFSDGGVKAARAVGGFCATAGIVEDDVRIVEADARCIGYGCVVAGFECVVAGLTRCTLVGVGDDWFEGVLYRMVSNSYVAGASCEVIGGDDARGKRNGRG